MSFALPVALIALVAIPALAWWYIARHRRSDRAAAAFVQPQLVDSVVARRPGFRRHLPMIAFALALVALIIAAARPQRSEAVPVNDGAVMLANDTSSSMASTDVSPSRLGAAIKADRIFLAHVPGSVRVGLLEFTVNATVLQSPSTNHALVSRALSGLHAYGHTAIGNALVTATQGLTSLHGDNGKRLPSAIILLSDGGSFIGVDPLAAARHAAAEHIPVYTIALGTARGTIPVGHRAVPVPLDATELRQIATLSHGRSFTAGDAATADTIYRHLASQLGHKKVERELTSSFAGAGLALLLIGSVLSLVWFGRLT
jgi:Ca-activated chloride channel family protein